MFTDNDHRWWLMHYLRFFYLAILTNLKMSLAFRVAFIIGILVTIVKQILFLVGWKFFFAKYRIVSGWNFDDMLLMYGIVCFAMGVVEAFFYGLKDIPRVVEIGQLDSFLLQPKNIILNLAVAKGDSMAFGEIITGIILIGYSGYLAKAPLLTVITLVVAVLFMFTLLLYLACLSFFMHDAVEFIRELNLNAIVVATQPNAAYSGTFKVFTMLVLPVAFLSFFPVEFLRTGLYKYLAIAASGTLIFFVIACRLFKKGLKRYESGNIIALRY